MKKTTSISIINWTARIIAALMVGLTLVIGIGELIEEHNQPGPGLDTYTLIIFVVWAIGLAGLLFAMWEPKTGGLISLVGFIVFNILAAVNPNPDSSYTVGLLLYFLPSILFLLVWWLKNRE